MVTFTKDAKACDDNSIKLYESTRKIIEAFTPIDGHYGYTCERGFREPRLISCHMMADALEKLSAGRLVAQHGYYQTPAHKYEHGWVQTGKEGDLIDVYPIADYTGTPRLHPWSWADSSGLFRKDSKVQAKWRQSKAYDDCVKMLIADLNKIGDELGINLAD